MYIERCIQTNDVENVFNLLKRIINAEGRGSQGQGDASTLAISINKMIKSQESMHSLNRSYRIPKQKASPYKNDWMEKKQARQNSITWGQTKKKSKMQNNVPKIKTLLQPAIPVRTFHKKQKGYETMPIDLTSD